MIAPESAKELKLRLKPSGALQRQVVDLLLGEPLLLAVISELGFCAVIKKLEIKNADCSQDSQRALLCGVLYRAISDRMTICKRPHSSTLLLDFFPGYDASQSNSLENSDVVKVLGFLRGRVRSWFSLKKLSSPWKDEESSAHETVQAVREVLLLWSADGHILRPLVTRLWSGLHGCMNLPSVAPNKKIRSWNPYYLMLEEAFDSMRVESSLFGSFTLFAGIDQWLSNCRLALGDSEHIKEWQNEADLIRDQAALSSLELMARGGHESFGEQAVGLLRLADRHV